MSTEIFCCNSKLYLTPCGPSWKLVFILLVCGRAPFLPPGVWLDMHLPIKVCSHCFQPQEGRWCKHWQHDCGIYHPTCQIISNVLGIPLRNFWTLIFKACFLLFATKIKNAAFGTSCLHFLCPQSQSPQPLSYSACFGFGTGTITAFNHLLFTKSGSITLLGCNMTERKGSQKSDVFVYFEFPQWPVTIPSSQNLQLVTHAKNTYATVKWLHAHKQKQMVNKQCCNPTVTPAQFQ